jgi:flagellar hook-length control protein FliK
VTSSVHATSAPSAHGAGDDAFAAMLGQAVKGNDKTDVSASTLDDGSAPQGGAADTPPADTLARLLHGLQPSGQTTAAPPQASDDDTSPDDRSDTTSDTTATPGDTAKGGDPASGKPATASSATDPVLAQLLAAQQAQPAQQAPATQDDAATGQPAAATDIIQAAASGFDTTVASAAARIAGGATIQPAKPRAGDETPAASDEKSQRKDTAATALANVGNTVTRSFADQRAGTAHALPLQAAADQAKNGNQSGGSAGEQKPGGAQTQQAVQAAADATPVKETFAPAPSAQAASLPANPAPGTQPLALTSPTAAANTQVQLQQTGHQAATPDVASLALNIAAKSEGGAKHFDIQLNPAELGRVDVRLTVDDAGKAQATLTVEKPQTLALLQKDSSHLASALKDAGLNLTQNGLNFSLKGQQQQTGGNSTPSRGRNIPIRATIAVDQAASHLSLSSVGASDARLDIRV